jgi:UDP-glucose 4-epimerase
MRVVITGASGLVGRTVVQQLLQEQNEVVVLGRNLQKLKDCFSAPVVCAQTNYEISQLVDHFKGSQAIIHLAGRRVAAAAEGFLPFYEANIQTTEHVMEAAGQANVCCVCQASSLSVYSSNNAVPCLETEPPLPASLYGISKLACEHIGLLAQHKYPLRVVSLRIAAVLGYGDTVGEGFMIARFIQLARRKKTLPIFGEGSGARDLIYVKDVANAMIRVLATAGPSAVYNIGSNRPYSVRELAETINQEFDNVGNITYDPTQPEDRRFLYMDCSRAMQALNWKPTWNLAAGLREIRDCYDAE